MACGYCGRAPCAAQLCHSVEDRLGDRILAHLLEAFDAATAIDECDDVGIHVETGALGGYIVRDHQMNTLGLKLAAGIGDEVARFSRKADQKPRSVQRPELSKDVRIRASRSWRSARPRLIL